MSVLRKEEEPLTTADIANQQRAGRTRGDAVIDETDIDPADRRPPQSAAARSVNSRDTVADDDTDDTYDGEIVNSSVEPVQSADVPSVGNVGSVSRPAPSGIGRQTPKQAPASGDEPANDNA